MGTVFKPKVTRPLPDGAKIITREGKQLAVWIGQDGKSQTAPLTGPKAKRPGIIVESHTFVAKYRDGDGLVKTVSTGCTNKESAKRRLKELEDMADKVRRGVYSKAEAAVADHAVATIDDHVDAYLDHLGCRLGKGGKRNLNAAHIANVRRALRLAVQECGWRRLNDLNTDDVARWVRRMVDMPAGKRLSLRTIGMRIGSLTSWGEWMEVSKRIVTNPFRKLRKKIGLTDTGEVRRKRRALTIDELRRLLTVARLRPIAEFGREKVRVIDENRPASSRATWKLAPLTFDTIHAAAERGRSKVRPDVAGRLDKAGRERALLYLTLVTTGLRKSELASITIRDVVLDEGQPVILLASEDAKNGQKATLPLRADVAEKLRQWIADNPEASMDEPLFDVPDGLSRIIDRDFAAAGIPKHDDRGRVVDAHALRHTFGTHLVAAGVAPRVAQAAMRHSKLELTMKVYTDPRMLDVAGAVAALPGFHAAGDQDGKAGPIAGFVAPDVAPNLVQRGISRGIVEEIARAAMRTAKWDSLVKTRCFSQNTEAPPPGLEPGTRGLTVRNDSVKKPLKTRAKRTSPPAVAPDVAPNPEIEPTGMAELLLLVEGLECLPADERRSMIRRIVGAAARHSQ